MLPAQQLLADWPVQIRPSLIYMNIFVNKATCSTDRFNLSLQQTEKRTGSENSQKDWIESAIISLSSRIRGCIFKIK